MPVKIYRSIWGNIFIFIFLGLLACFMALPLVFTISMAFKPIDELFLYPPRFFVMKPTLKNFRDLFSIMGNSLVPFTRFLFNSIIIGVIGTVGHVIIASMAAYPLAKKKFPGSTIIFQIIVLSLMFNAYVTGIPRFVILSKLGWLNDYKALILPGVASSLGLYLMRQFMTQVPDAYIESARIEGAGEFRTLWYAVMPLVKPAWLTLSLLSFIGFWGDTGSPALYITNEALKTLPLALSYIQAGGIARTGATAATGLLMMIPPILFFILSQSSMIDTMKTAGLKE